MWNQAFVDRLLQGDAQAIDVAHGLLMEEGYTLIGFHGCGADDAENIVPDLLDAGQAGANTGGGLARGRGFYVGAYYRHLPRQWANIRQGKGMGNATILRVYAKAFPMMKVGLDYDWGAMDAIRIADATLGEVRNAGVGAIAAAFAGEDLAELGNDMELVIRPVAYDRIIAIPSKGHLDQALLRPANAWKAKEAPF